MKKYFFMAVAAIAALSSCSNYDEFEQNQTGNQGLVFTATMEGSEGTRAILATGKDNKKFASWEAGDQISINGKTYSAKEGGATAIFKADGEDATGEPYKAYFPASLYDGTLPTIQTYEPGKFNMPMYAESTTTELQFKNLCAVLAIKVTSADIATLKSIKVASDKNLSGNFSIIDDTAKVSTSRYTSPVVLESKEALTLTEEGTTFYIAIPAQKYNYLNIFLSSDGETYTQAMATKKVEGIGKIDRNTIYNIDYVKNATKLWEGNVFVADCNVGATSATEYGDYYDGSALIKNIWGSNWTLPGKEELKEINDLGAWDVAKKGLLCTSTIYPGNSVFLPAAGHINDGSVINGDIEGCYWSSEANSSQNASFLQFKAETHIISREFNSFKYSFRPVLMEADLPVAPTTTGTAKAKIGDEEVDVNWVQLWENGPKFAEYNVGVTDGKATSYGGYYAWGGSQAVEEDQKTDDHNTGSGVLTGDTDTATKLWGSNWRMPTQAELQELLDNCTVEEVTIEGVKGLKFTGKDDYEDNSVFLPAADYYNYNTYWGYFLSVNKYVMYWSSTPYDSDAAYYLNYNFKSASSVSDRIFAHTIRAVLAE